MSYNLQSRTEYGVSDRAQIHPRAALAPARPDQAHDPNPRPRPALCATVPRGQGQRWSGATLLRSSRLSRCAATQAPFSQRLAVFTSACASLVCHPQISLESLDRDARQGPRVCRWSLVDCRHAPDPAPATHIVVAFVNVAFVNVAVDIVFASRGCAACVVGGVWAVADRSGLGRDPPAGQRTTHARGTGRPGHAVR